MKKLVLACAVSAIVSCGGGSGGGGSQSPAPSAPTPPPTPQPINNWSIAGTLVDTVGRQPISGATITPDWSLAAIQTNGDGSYALGAPANPPTTPYKLTVSGADLLTRELWVTWQQGPRTGVMLDAIRLSAPFSLDYYKQLVRGTYDQPGAPHVVFRWMEAPRFYLKTVDQNGRPIEPEVLAVVREALPRAVTEFTGGRLSAAALDTGTDVRPPTPGWINVDIVRDPNERQVCGFANIGANPGSITLNNDVCSCGSNKIPGALVLHEVGHALGFFHVGERNAIMYPFIPGNCPSGQLSPSEKFHSAIAYTRPRGNRDPDIDPASGQFLQPTQPIVIVER